MLENLLPPHGETLANSSNKTSNQHQARSKFGGVICCFHGLYGKRNAEVLGGISENGDWESTFCRVVSKQRGKETQEESPRTASSCPFAQRSNKASRRSASSSRRASVAEIAGLLPAFSDVFAVFLSKGNPVRTCHFLFFFFRTAI